ncbi:hypothetical protein PC128_g23987 [Phytophthora cactorum]|nr:hypothetical protein C6341_g24081 [Phytophthora cactorum]KAG3146559.1 hypothetical protein PC128_g23987 [Phytophthora cactorum]
MARGKPLTPHEKCRIVKAHEYFTSEEKAERSEGVGTRERVAACLDIGLATVARVILFWNKNPGTKFDEPLAQVIASTRHPSSEESQSTKIKEWERTQEYYTVLPTLMKEPQHGPKKN